MANWNSVGWPNWNANNPMTTGTAWQPNAQYPSPSQPIGYSQQKQQPMNNLLKVAGPESARAFQAPPGSTVVLFDADNPIFYILIKDDSGFPTLRTFNFEEVRPIEVPAEMTAAANDELRKEVEGLKTDISEIKAMLEGLVN